MQGNSSHALLTVETVVGKQDAGMTGGIVGDTKCSNDNKVA